MSLVVGMLSPNTIYAHVVKPASMASFTPAAVVSASFRVTKPSGATQTWNGTISNVTATSLDVEHAFAASELDEAGPYSARVQMNTSTNPYYSDDFNFEVEEI